MQIKKHGAIKVLCLVVVIVQIMIGCNQALKTSIKTGEDSGSMYINFDQEYDELLKDAKTEDQRHFLKSKVAPALNELKRAEISYNKALIKWATSGKEPDNLQALGDDHLKKLAKVKALFATAGGGN